MLYPSAPCLHHPCHVGWRALVLAPHSHFLGSMLSGKSGDTWLWAALLPLPSFVSALYLQPLLTERFAMLHAVIHTQVGLVSAICCDDMLLARFLRGHSPAAGSLFNCVPRLFSTF